MSALRVRLALVVLLTISGTAIAGCDHARTAHASPNATDLLLSVNGKYVAWNPVTHVEKPTTMPIKAAPVPASANGQLFWGSYEGSLGVTSTLYVSRLPAGKPTLLTSNVDTPQQMAASSRYLYWTDGSVFWLPLLGGTVESLKLPAQPSGSAADGLVVSGKYVYVSQYFNDQIGRFDMGVTHPRVEWLLETKAPSHLVVGDGFIYWITPKGIGRAHLDGTDAEPTWLVLPTVRQPVLMAFLNHSLYWTWISGPGNSPAYLARAQVADRAVNYKVRQVTDDLVITLIPR